MDIKGKVAVVSGGASGMGLEIVKRLVSLGAKAAIFDMNAAAGEAAVAELGDAVMFADVNVTSEESVQAGVNATMAAFGAIHICVNCAGIATGSKTLGKDGPFPLDLWQKTLAVNLTGTFNVLRLCAEQMAKNTPDNEDGVRGAIVNTASVAAFEGQVGQAAYSASKGGIVGMTLPIARDLSTVGIRVNTIAPGLINTPMFESLPAPVYQALSSTPLFPKRLGRAPEIAHMVTSIIENDYINGECIRMDAGLRMQPK
ncbi:SDR family NAD(P)-dependent oxidoreductase [Zhongshania marina]|uniref:3-hydroxyacyl-CoA dehydrogenase n=1 Tax=Zhongshania marina TaxID=2304603 RepID=A0A2S4HJV4_9GAMM|nr:SDR family NAD(P)-dependent oxidoreductase [Marortus luteolus]POP54180.1 3-hydroxyacyl-CoA dehydrogenase [Marortus luteolus]RNL60935.1 SDR family NAD(P)-dependent oxidoreductase [Zhongshania marina]